MSFGPFCNAAGIYIVSGHLESTPFAVLYFFYKWLLCLKRISADLVIIIRQNVLYNIKIKLLFD